MSDKKIWIYCRTANNDGNNLDAQYRYLENFAKQRGWDIIGSSKETGSGLNFDRPGLKHMMSAAEESRINMILAKDMASIGRDMIKLIGYTEKLNGCGVELLFVSHG